jgi:hypothetical protein
MTRIAINGFGRIGRHVLRRIAKVFAWYDNEAGYAARVVDLCRLLATGLVRPAADGARRGEAPVAVPAAPATSACRSATDS